jgi:hypothetical protein
VRRRSCFELKTPFVVFVCPRARLLFAFVPRLVFAPGRNSAGWGFRSVRFVARACMQFTGFPIFLSTMLLYCCVCWKVRGHVAASMLASSAESRRLLSLCRSGFGCHARPCVARAGVDEQINGGQLDPLSHRAGARRGFSWRFLGPARTNKCAHDRGMRFANETRRCTSDHLIDR